jgi:iron complex outermembrane recepter protein
MSKYHFLKRPAKNKLALSVAALMAFGAGVTNVSYAQDEEEETALEEITVTGSRIRRDDFNNAQPTTVIDSDFMSNLGIVNLGDALATLPSNVGNTTPATNSNSNFYSGNNIANLRGLNPFFGSRTLTLVDSRRHVPTNQSDSVDLNFIPTILIERFETVTGGASASYGSGAISGVNNIIMNRSLDGGKVQVDFGQTAQGDGDDTHIGLAWGMDVGEAGHFVIGYESQDSDEIGHCALDRDWCAPNYDEVNNSGYATNSDPQYIIVEGVQQQNQHFNGVIPSLGLKFNDAGTGTEPFSQGGQYNIGGEGKGLYDETNLRSNIDKEVLFMAFDYQFSDDLGFFAEASFGEVKTGTEQFSNTNNMFIRADNAYFQQLGANNPIGGAPFVFMNKDWGPQNNTYNKNEAEVSRYALGFNGRFGDSTWTWDAYFETGESDKLQVVHGNSHQVAFGLATDAVFAIDGDPNSGIVCRVTRDGVPANASYDPRIAENCAPVNPIGANGLSAEGYAYAFGQLDEQTNIKQDVWEAVASGEVWEGFGAGPIQAALGISLRNEELLNISDPSQPDHIRTDYLIQYGESFGGDVEVLEYFVELDVPITEDLSVRAAARRSDYTNTAGFNTGIEGKEFDYGITTWKVDGTWQATDWLAFRGSKSHDIRAPNFRELYYEQIIPAGSPFGYCTNEWTGNINNGIFSFTGDPCEVNLKGGLSLKPESGDTITAGIVLTPDQFNVRFAVDFFSIEIEDGINAADTNLTLDACFRGKDPFFCSSIDGTLIDPNDPVGGFSVITGVHPEAFNFAVYDVEGVDISADWIGEYDFGTVSLRFLASHMKHQIVTPSASNPTLTQDLAGITGNASGLFANYAPAPDWSANVTGTFSNGPLTATLQSRYIADGKVANNRIGPEDAGYSDTLPNSRFTNRVGGYVNWTLSGSYNFTVADTELSVFGTVNNLFDRDPPIIGNGTGGTNPVFFDTIGRQYRVGLRASF